MTAPDLELVPERKLINEVLRRFDHGIFIGVRPPPRDDGTGDYVNICKWGSETFMAFHCRAFADAIERTECEKIQVMLAEEAEMED